MFSDLHPNVAMEIIEREKRALQVVKDFLHFNNLKGVKTLLPLIEKNISRLEKI